MTIDNAAAERRLGIVLLTASAVVFGLAGVFTKLVSADSLTIACWRGLVGGLVMTVYVWWRRRGAAVPESLSLGWRGWLLAIVGSLASIAFISAFKFSYVANVTIIYATVPFAAALLGWLVIGEQLRTRTLVAASVSLVGVGIMVFAGLRGVSYVGDGIALVMTLLSALYIVLVRMFRDAPVVWAAAVSAYLLFVLGWFVTDPLQVAAGDWIFLVAFGCSSAVAIVLWTEGARYVPAGEAGLLGIAEVPAGIVLAWLILSEIPPWASVTGGAVVLAAVVWHAGRDWLEGRARRPLPAQPVP